jgi:hypothetical protein
LNACLLLLEVLQSISSNNQSCERIVEVTLHD